MLLNWPSNLTITPPSSVPDRPSAGELPTLRLQPTNVLFWFPDPASHIQACTPPKLFGWWYLAWVWVGGAKETGPPRGGLESIVSPTGITGQAAKCMPTPDSRLPSQFLRSTIVMSPSTRLVGVALESVPSSTLEFSLESCVPISLSAPPHPKPSTTGRIGRGGGHE